jgi:hypothetical protein
MLQGDTVTLPGDALSATEAHARLEVGTAAGHLLVHP